MLETGGKREGVKKREREKERSEMKGEEERVKSGGAEGRRQSGKPTR